MKVNDIGSQHADYKQMRPKHASDFLPGECGHFDDKLRFCHLSDSGTEDV